MYNNEMEESGSDDLKKLVKPNPILICFDDIIQDAKIRRSPLLNELFTLGRHLHISTIILSQTISGQTASLPPVVRYNAEIIQCFHTFNEYDLELLGSQFASPD